MAFGQSSHFIEPHVKAAAFPRLLEFHSHHHRSGSLAACTRQIPSAVSAPHLDKERVRCSVWGAPATQAAIRSCKASDEGISHADDFEHDGSVKCPADNKSRST